VTPTRTILEAGHLEIASALVKRSLLGLPTRTAREALEARAAMYTAAAKVSRPRSVEVLFHMGRLQGHNPRFRILCEHLNHQPG
jgi:hypothetical protein